MAGSNNFVLSVKTWIERTNAIGIISKPGRYGGTYAHRDLAYHFGMWIRNKFWSQTPEIRALPARLAASLVQVRL